VPGQSPGQMPQLLEQSVELFEPDCVLVFIDVTSNLSDRRGKRIRYKMKELGIPVHLIYSKNDVQGYNNKLNTMIHNVPCSEYSVISARFGTNIHNPLLWTIELFK